MIADERCEQSLINSSFFFLRQRLRYSLLPFVDVSQNVLYPDNTEQVLELQKLYKQI